MGLIISVIYIIGFGGTFLLADYVCNKYKYSISQTATGSAALGYTVGSIIGVVLLGIARG